MKKIRYGVIGIKRVGRRHMTAVLDNEQAELVTLVDTDEELLKRTSAEMGIKGFTDYRDILEKDMVDAVSIATPNHFHYPIGMECLKAGVHIFVEKPFTTRLSEADALVAFAKRKGLKIAVNYLYRTFQSPQFLKELVNSDALGRMMRVLWTWGHFKPEGYYENDPWRGSFQQAGGGVLMSNACHELDLIRWLVGEPAEVSANIGNQLHKAEIEDMVCANVIFANGAFGSLQFTTNQPPAYSVRQIAGDKGIVVLPNIQSLYTDQLDKIVFGQYHTPLGALMHQAKDKPSPKEIVWQSIPNSDDHHSVWRATEKLKNQLRRIGILKKPVRVSGDRLIMNSFVEAILHGGEPLVNGEWGRSSMEFTNGIFLSAMRKKTVTFPMDPEEFDHLFEEMVSGKIKIPQFR